MTATLEPDVEPAWLTDPDLLVPPAYYSCPEYVATLGPEVVDLVALFGRTANPEQRLLLDGSFGMNRHGRLSAFEVFVLAARQNLKTGFLEMRALGKALLLKRPLQVWTAHKESATDQALADFRSMIEASDELSRRVKRITEGKGSKSIEFLNDCTIVFRPRTGKAGQSMSADDVDLDEYFAAEPQHLGSLIPTMSTRPNAQIGEASSAPHAGSDEQRSVMKRGRMASLGLVVEPRLLYAEWSVQQQVGVYPDGTPKFGPPPCMREDCTHALGSVGCIADNRQLIKLANPSVGRSAAPAISWDYIADERRKLQGDALPEYFRERLSSGDEGAAANAVTVFGKFEVWSAGTTDRVADGVGGVGIAMSADRQWFGICGSSIVEWVDPTDPEAEPIDLVLTAPLLHTSDLDVAIKFLQELQEEHDCAIGLDEAGPAGELLEDFEDADLAIEPFDLRRYAKACGKYSDKVTRRRPGLGPELLHLVNDELDAAVVAAEWKWVRDSRVIARREGSEVLDTTLLEGSIIATALAENAGTFGIY